MQVRPRDFIETKDGYVFAVVEYHHPGGRIISTLRFIKEDDCYRKIASSNEAFKILEDQHPDYLLKSYIAGTTLQTVPEEDITRVLRPDVYLAKLSPDDEFKKNILELAGLLSNDSGVPIHKIGVTGSVLINAHNENSDIDLVIYGLSNFNKVRLYLKEHWNPDLGSKLLEDWYNKRLPTRELTREEFIYHQQRKYNYGLFNDRKFDLLYTRDWGEIEGRYGQVRYRKLRPTIVSGRVHNDMWSFDTPARYKIISSDGSGVTEIVSYTHTYTGQAFKGEEIETKGMLEEEIEGKNVKLRLLVGSSREATGEYIKVKT